MYRWHFWPLPADEACPGVLLTARWAVHSLAAEGSMFVRIGSGGQVRQALRLRARCRYGRAGPGDATRVPARADAGRRDFAMAVKGEVTRDAVGARLPQIWDFVMRSPGDRGRGRAARPSAP